MNNNNKNFRKPHLKNPTICWKGGKYHEANQIACIHIGTVHDYQNGFNDKYLIYFPFLFFRMFKCYFKKRRTPTGFWNVKIGVFIYAHLFYFGATFSFAAKGIGKNIGVVDKLIANRNFSGYPEFVMETWLVIVQCNCSKI